MIKNKSDRRTIVRAVYKLEEMYRMSKRFNDCLDSVDTLEKNLETLRRNNMPTDVVKATEKTLKLAKTHLKGLAGFALDAWNEGFKFIEEEYMTMLEVYTGRATPRDIQKRERDRRS